MSDVIGFLESMGALPAPGAAEFAQGVEALGLAPAMRQALLRRDADAMNRLLGGRAAMWCAIMSPEEAPETDTPDEDSPDDGTPGDDDPDGDAPARGTPGCVTPSPDANEA